MLVSLQLALYALLWALIGLAIKDARPAITQWTGYALATAAAAALLGWRPDGPVWLTHTGSSAATVLSLLLASRGVLLFLELRPPDKLLLAIAATAALCFGWVGPYDTDYRLGVMGFFNVVVLLLVFLRCAKSFIREFGLPVSAAATFPVVAMGCLNGYFFVRGMARGGLDVAGSGAVSAATWTVTLVSAAAFNFLFMFLVSFRLQRDLRRQASHDAVTGLPNRRAMEQRLQLEWDRSVRYGKPLVVIAVDVDHFKRINDTYGHAVGDTALIAVAKALQGSARDSDQVSRCGGEEFLIVMPEANMQTDGMAMAERLREAVTRVALTSPGGEAIALSASFGVSGWLASDQRREDMLRRADSAMYAAKAKGRNCAVLQTS